MLRAMLVLAVIGAGSCKSCSGGSLKYMWGDALTDSPGCTGPDGDEYPQKDVLRSYFSGRRKGKTMPMIADPWSIRKSLLDQHMMTRTERAARDTSKKSSATCEEPPSRLCRTRYNTTAPMYGISLTSGERVTIVQKFPDLLQQVVFEVCESRSCDVVHGECVQTYVPYLFLVIPLGPVTLTGQDYILVESGCICKPRYSSGAIQEQFEVEGGAKS